MFHAPVLNSNTGQWEAVSPLTGTPVEDNNRERLVETLRGLQATRDHRDAVDRLTLDCQQYMDKLEICVRGLEDIRKHSEDAFSSVTAEETLEKVFGKVPRV